MSFFKKLGQEGKQEESINKLEGEIKTLTQVKDKAWHNLKNSPTYQDEIVKKSKAALEEFSSYFRNNGFTILQADPRGDAEKVEAKSGQYNFSLIHTMNNTLYFETKGYDEHIYLVDKNSPTNEFNGIIVLNGVFIDGHRYLKDTSVLEEAIEALKKDIEVLEELKTNAYTPQLAFLDKTENVFNTIEEYFNSIEEKLEGIFELNSDRV